MSLNKDLKAAFKGALFSSQEWTYEVLPTGLVPLDLALVCGGFGEGRIGEVFGSWSTGKGQPASSKVVTIDGWKPIGELEPGHLVAGQDGKFHQVIGVFPKECQPTYRVHFSDGTNVIVDDDHLWEVMTSNDIKKGRTRTISTKELRQKKLTYGYRKNRKYAIPTCEPVAFPASPVPMDAYLLGALLGDGCFRSGTPTFTNADSGVVAAVRRRLPPNLLLNQKKNSEIDYSISGKKGLENPVTATLRGFRLDGLYSHQKFIPDGYLYNSLAVRWDLFWGLMDTDGSTDSTFSSSSKQLRDQFVELARSLGIIVSTYTKEEPKYVYRGERRAGRTSYGAYLTIHDRNKLFRFRSDKPVFPPRKRNHLKYIVKITRDEDQPTVCISVDSPKNLYLTEHYTVTHNTLILYLWLIETQKNGGKAFLFESEGGFHADWFVALGGTFGTGTEEDLLVVPNLKSVEDFFSGCDTIIKVIEKSKFKGQVAIGWDSLAATGTKLLDKKGVEGSHAAKKALIISEGVTRLSSQITGSRISVVNINQSRIKMGAKDWEETHTPGGRQWPYLCSTRIEVEFDGGPSGSKIVDDDGEMIGRSIRGKVVKNKLGPPFGEFKFPVYTVPGVKHPVFEGVRTKVGIDCEEALLDWYLSSRKATFGDDNEHRFMKIGGGGYVTLNADVFGEVKKFRKKDWLKTLEQYPMLLKPDELVK